MEKDLGELMGETTEAFKLALDQISACLRDTARGLRERATEAADTVVPADKEEAKRNIVSLLRDQAAHCERMAVAVDRDPVSGKQISDEIFGMLKNGWGVAIQANVHHDPAAILGWFRERANNLAQAYQGRLLPE